MVYCSYVVPSRIYSCKSNVYLVFNTVFLLSAITSSWKKTFYMNQKIYIEKLGFSDFAYTNCLDCLLHPADSIVLTFSDSEKRRSSGSFRYLIMRGADDVFILMWEYQEISSTKMKWFDLVTSAVLEAFTELDSVKSLIYQN